MNSVSIYLLAKTAGYMENVTVSNLVKMTFDWRFILGIGLGFAMRYVFVAFINIYKGNATVAFFVSTITIVAAIITNYWWLGNTVKGTQWIGSALIIAGIVMIG